MGNGEFSKQQISEGKLSEVFLSQTKKELKASIYYLNVDKTFPVEYIDANGKCYSGIWDYFPKDDKLVLINADSNTEADICYVMNMAGYSLVFQKEIESIGGIDLKLERLEKNYDESVKS